MPGQLTRKKSRKVLSSIRPKNQVVRWGLSRPKGPINMRSPEELMNVRRSDSIVDLDHFIRATRDSGYKGTPWAVAELIDNSFEAGATKASIRIVESDAPDKPGLTLSVEDDGKGMQPSVLSVALQFGGSTRFNSRLGSGRYGMGLPNSSLNQAQRVDVYSWTRCEEIWWSYLDVDEITSGRTRHVPEPKRARLNPVHELLSSKHGTLVVWSKCDRLDYKRAKKLAQKLHSDLSRIFRYHLWKGKSLLVNGESVQPIDPLFLTAGRNLTGAEHYGPPLKYEVEPPDSPSRRVPSTIRARFAELPIEKWHAYSNEEKRNSGISKNAGVSILRAGREIDYGWFFMGSKRKENYDDWWRCELWFEPELDEVFGVSNTKQGIHPTEFITGILAPEIEPIAHQLNARVRKRYLAVKRKTDYSPAERHAQRRDLLLEPPSAIGPPERDRDRNRMNGGNYFSRAGGLKGIRYRIEDVALEEVSFFIPRFEGNEVVVCLNKEHPFYERMYEPLKQLKSVDPRKFRGNMDLLLFAAARAECQLGAGDPRKSLAHKLRESWSNILATFLE